MLLGDQFDQFFRQCVFRHLWKGLLLILPVGNDGILVAVKSDLSVGDIVGDDHVQFLRCNLPRA